MFLASKAIRERLTDYARGRCARATRRPMSLKAAAKSWIDTMDDGAANAAAADALQALELRQDRLL